MCLVTKQVPLTVDLYDCIGRPARRDSACSEHTGVQVCCSIQVYSRDKPDGRDREVGLLARRQRAVGDHGDGSSTLAWSPQGLRAPEQVHIELQLLVGQVFHPEWGVDSQHLHAMQEIKGWQ